MPVSSLETSVFSRAPVQLSNTVSQVLARPSEWLELFKASRKRDAFFFALIGRQQSLREVENGRSETAKYAGIRNFVVRHTNFEQWLALGGLGRNTRFEVPDSKVWTTAKCEVVLVSWLSSLVGHWAEVAESVSRMRRPIAPQNAFNQAAIWGDSKSPTSKGCFERAHQGSLELYESSVSRRSGESSRPTPRQRYAMEARSTCQSQSNMMGNTMNGIEVFDMNPSFIAIGRLELLQSFESRPNRLFRNERRARKLRIRRHPTATRFGI